MDKIPIIFAKLAGLHKKIKSVLSGGGFYFDPPFALELFGQYANLRDDLVSSLPELYSDLIIRPLPQSSGTTDFNGRGYIGHGEIIILLRDIDYIFEVRSHSRIGETPTEKPRRVFISHGRNQDWLQVQVYIEKDVKVQTLELAQEPNKGRTVLQKLGEESDKCSFAVIVMTGDDDLGVGAPRARENVMHEIGFFQGKYGLERVCLLYEEGTNIPSNIHGLVYIPFPKGYVNATFGPLQRELNSAIQE
ncbi:MAG: nucleotide-binding protein [Bacteroidota bacterium]